MLAILCTLALAIGSEQPAAPVLYGKVTDQTGLPLPGVSVESASAGRKVTRTTITDGDGRYAFETLEAGKYELLFTELNFAPHRRRDIAIGREPQRVDAVLQLAVNASVVVTGSQTFRNLAD